MNSIEKVRALGESLSFDPLNPKDYLNWLGSFAMFGVWAIMFAETGLLLGFFLPGDSLLFIAGVAASPVADIMGFTPIPIVGLLIGAPIFAILGAQTGHWLGARYGRRLFDKPDSRFFKKEYVEKTELYFQKFGPGKAVVLARFIPIVRTFMNPVAGVLGMPAKQFLLWNIIGGILWTDGILLAGYFLAERIEKSIGAENIDKYILPFVFLIVLVSMIPIFIEMGRSRREKRRERERNHADAVL